MGAIDRLTLFLQKEPAQDKIPLDQEDNKANWWPHSTGYSNGEEEWKLVLCKKCLSKPATCRRHPRIPHPLSRILHAMFPLATSRKPGKLICLAN